VSLSGTESPVGIYQRLRVSSNYDLTGGHSYLVGEKTLYWLLYIEHLELEAIPHDPTGVSCLSTGFGIQSGSIQEQLTELTCGQTWHRIAIPD
jgi:hypothetical protein